MRRYYSFASQISLGPTFNAPDDEASVKNEPMFFNCDLDFAYAKGGPITRAFLGSLPFEVAEAPDAVFDSRVHMLMPGWYPCIPGWHHDDVPRSRGDGQPNYDNPEYRSKHVLGLVNGDICPTVFALGYHELPEVPLGGKIYKSWDSLVSNLVDQGGLYLEKAPSNRLVFFDWQTMHTGVKAITNGWRWFGRVSWNTHRKPTNEIRRQVQVYLENPKEGW